MTHIIKNKNNDYQYLETIKNNRSKRFGEKRFFVEGVRNVNESIKNGWKTDYVICNGDAELSGWAKGIISELRKSAEIVYLANGLMAEISGKEGTSEIVLINRMRESRLGDIKLKEDSVMLVFDRPSNKGNLGTIIRTADSFGVDAVISTGHAVDFYDTEVIGATMGSFFSQQFAAAASPTEVLDWVQNCKKLHPNLLLCGTSAKAEQYICGGNFAGTPVVAVIGNETAGMSKAFFDMCDAIYKIPMAEGASASSLNVACAASVVLYEVMRGRYLR